MLEVTTIGEVSISAGWENNCPILLLKNHGQKGELVDFRYLKHGSHSSESWERLHLPFDSQLKVQLPEDFKRWAKFGFHISGERLLAPVSDLIKLLDGTRKLMKSNPSQPSSEPSISKSEPTDNPIDKDLPDIESTNVPEQHATDYQHEAETIVRETWERLTELARTYKNGEPIDFVNIENPMPRQNVLLILNWIAGTIREWKNELEQSGETDRNLIDTLTCSEQAIREKLKAIRGESTPGPNQLELDTDINTDTALNEIRNECALHVRWFEGRLFGYEERCEIDDLEEYDQFIPKFIKDRLFNGVARFLTFEQLPEHLEQCLQLIGYEVIPIELGKTKADARVHEIQSSRQTGVDPGAIVEIILPGLRRKADGEIVQKPVVIRGE